LGKKRTRSWGGEPGGEVPKRVPIPRTLKSHQHLTRRRGEKTAGFSSSGKGTPETCYCSGEEKVDVIDTRKDLSPLPINSDRGNGYQKKGKRTRRMRERYKKGVALTEGRQASRKKRRPPLGEFLRNTKRRQQKGLAGFLNARCEARGPRSLGVSRGWRWAACWANWRFDYLSRKRGNLGGRHTSRVRSEGL